MTQHNALKGQYQYAKSRKMPTSCFSDVLCVNKDQNIEQLRNFCQQSTKTACLEILTVLSEKFYCASQRLDSSLKSTCVKTIDILTNNQNLGLDTSGKST
ncbi:hypothetical protein PV326_008717 [Microctonus aethiopoides]|nr:hypothetical protein PV326_008717 [Microctonus aethiopoides]